jgi:hypothetical protein
MSFRLSPSKSPVSWIDHWPGTLETNDRRSAPLCYKKKDALETASAFSFEVITVSETQDQIEMLVGAAHGCAEAATLTTNELVGRTLEAAVSGKEAAATLHHAYSAQVHVARVLDWVTEWARAADRTSSNSSPTKFDEWLNWLQRARSHAERLCRCFPASEKAEGDAPGIAEWAERWPRDYLEAKSRAEKSLEKLDTAIGAIERQRRIEMSGKSA